MKIYVQEKFREIDSIENKLTVCLSGNNKNKLIKKDYKLNLLGHRIT